MLKERKKDMKYIEEEKGEKNHNHYIYKPNIIIKKQNSKKGKNNNMSQDRPKVQLHYIKGLQN